MREFITSQITTIVSNKNLTKNDYVMLINLVTNPEFVQLFGDSCPLIKELNRLLTEKVTITARSFNSKSMLSGYSLFKSQHEETLREYILGILLSSTPGALDAVFRQSLTEIDKHGHLQADSRVMKTMEELVNLAKEPAVGWEALRKAINGNKSDSRGLLLVQGLRDKLGTASQVQRPAVLFKPLS